MTNNSYCTGSRTFGLRVNGVLWGPFPKIGPREPRISPVIDPKAIKIKPNPDPDQNRDIPRLLAESYVWYLGPMHWVMLYFGGSKSCQEI